PAGGWVLTCGRRRCSPPPPDRPAEGVRGAGRERDDPPGTCGDGRRLLHSLLCARARRRGLSNDRYRDRLEAFPDARDRVIRYMIVNGEVVFEKRTKRR